jgi:hypothetical protein
MKALLLTVALLATATTAQAEESKGELCLAIESQASKIMEVRQKGVSLKDVLELSQDDYFRGVAILAYKSPRYNGDAYKQRAITEFANKAYINCLESSQ